ncbi:MAG: response regulator transcription factor [Bacteroidales bacterium]|nr:response regulator transcription factor [Bacteroidales bacterium]
MLFLSLTLVVAVLLVVFGQPTSILGYFEQQSSLTPLGQITISFISGFGVLALSRVLLSFVGRKHDLSPAAMVIWIVAELIVCVSVIALVLWGLCGGGTVDLASLVGALVLGMAGVLLVPTVVTYLIRRLREAQDEVVRLRQLTGHQDGQAKQAAEASVNFFAKGGRLAFSTRMGNILYIEAADNYVNIHYINGEKEETFILFNSMKNIEKSFAGTSLMRCHRGYMVNADNVRLMRKESLGLVLEINHCAKTIPVSKSFAEPVTQYFAYNTNMTLPNE